MSRSSFVAARNPDESREPDRLEVLRLLVVRRRVDDLARVDLPQVQVVVAGAVGHPADGDPAAVRRDAPDPAPAARLEAPLLSARQRARDDVEVASVAAVRRVREQRPVAADVRRRVHEARIDDERLRLGARLRVEQVELRPLVPALVHLEQDPPVRQELPRHRLREVGQLPELAAARRHDVQLLCAGHVRRDEQRRSVGGERQRQRLPHLEQRPQIGRPAQAATPENSGMMSSPYACSVSSCACVIR